MGRLQDGVDQGQDETKEQLTTLCGLSKESAIRCGARASLKERGGPEEGFKDVILNTINATCSSVKGVDESVELLVLRSMGRQ